MKTCPICDEPVKDVDRSCQCGELLQPWKTIEFYGTTLRQRGLALAGQGDYLGACLSFLEAVVSNPLDSSCALDAVRSLTHLERFDDATLLLKAVANRVNKDDAQALAAAIADRVEQRRTATESGRTAHPNHRRWFRRPRSASRAGRCWRCPAFRGGNRLLPGCSLTRRPKPSGNWSCRPRNVRTGTGRR